jgi:hypothetical protein
MPRATTKQTPTPITATKTEPTQIALPEHIKLSERELATCARFARCIRDEDNLVGYLVEALLNADTDSPEYLNKKDVLHIIDNIWNFNTWVETTKIVKANFPTLMNHPTLSGIPTTRTGAPLIPDEPDQFYELVRLWRKDYPEPEKRRLHPAGHLGHEESGD